MLARLTEEEAKIYLTDLVDLIDSELVCEFLVTEIKAFVLVVISEADHELLNILLLQALGDKLDVIHQVQIDSDPVVNHFLLDLVLYMVQRILVVWHENDGGERLVRQALLQLAEWVLALDYK